MRNSNQRELRKQICYPNSSDSDLDIRYPSALRRERREIDSRWLAGRDR
jgi:hypothetical protein